MQAELTGALKHGGALREIYSELRAARDEAERVALLQRAAQCVDALGTELSRCSGTYAPESMDEETRFALNGLGEIMEQVMVLEREYRVGNGAFSAGRMGEGPA